MIPHVVTSRHVLIDNQLQPAAIAFAHGRIISVDLSYQPNPDNSNMIDCGDLCVLPGLVDSHVHVNEPGRTEWEGFSTATRAAAAGGCTCIVDMPLNSIPATTTVESLERKREAALGKCVVDYAFWGGVIPGNQNEIIPLAGAGARGFKCFLSDSGVPEFPRVTEEDLDQSMPLIAETGLPLLIHAELSSALKQPGADWNLHSTHLESRPPQAEVEAIQLAIALCRKHRCRIHIVHVSAAQALPLIENAKREGLPVTAETCPHYLFFACDEIPMGATHFKCAPPIRDAENRELLWQGLRSGILDLVATDHSPCPPELKGLEAGNFLTAWGGISSLALALTAVWTGAEKRGVALAQVAAWMSANSAKLAGLQNRKGQIAPGFDADFVVFNPACQFSVTPGHLHSRHCVSPYVGERLSGTIERVYLRGELVYNHGQFAVHTRGLELAPSSLMS